MIFLKTQNKYFVLSASRRHSHPLPTNSCTIEFTMHFSDKVTGDKSLSINSKLLDTKHKLVFIIMSLNSCRILVSTIDYTLAV